VAEYILLTKGADNIMLPLINFEDGMEEIVNNHLTKFSKKGLRTLVMGKKDLSSSDVDHIVETIESTMKDNSLSKDDKELKLMKIYDDYENTLHYIGCSAIEDQL